MRSILFFAFSFLFFYPQLEAKIFTSNYIRFQLPERWGCNRDNSTHICHLVGGPKNKDAVILVTAKQTGPSDSLSFYKEYLSVPVEWKRKDNTVLKSSPVRTKQVTIDKAVWLDSLHRGGEVKEYYTRYFATRKKDISILVTFSAHRDVYPSYSAIINSLIKSIKVVDAKSIEQIKNNGGATGTGPIGSTNIGIQPVGNYLPSAKKSGNTVNIIIGLLLLLIGGGLYWYIKKKKK